MDTANVSPTSGSGKIPTEKTLHRKLKCIKRESQLQDRELTVDSSWQKTHYYRGRVKPRELAAEHQQELNKSYRIVVRRTLVTINCG